MTENKILAIFNALEHLITHNGHTTTLDVKNHLRRLYPNEKWYQDDISDVIDEIYTAKSIPNLVYTQVQDGTHTYRKYSIPNSIKLVKLTKTEIAKNVLSYFTTSNKPIQVKIDKEGDIVNRTYSCPSKTADVFGYINVINENNEPRKLDLRKLVSATIDNIEYTTL
jgi:hypothetical protein